MKRIVKALCVTVAVFLAVLSIGYNTASANTSTSQYINFYDAYLIPVSNGGIEIWFEIVGMGLMDKIGATKIIVQQSSDQSAWTTVATYTDEANPSMLTTEQMSYTSSVLHQGTVGLYYRAYVTVYAEKNGGSDSRVYLTSVVQAKRK